MAKLYQAAVIPALDPGPRLLDLIRDLRAQGLPDIILVDDGSEEAAQPIFQRAAAEPGVRCLRHPENRGKGAALRTAFRYFLEHFPDHSGVVTVDADGQHGAAEAAKVAAVSARNPDKLVIGTRTFAGTNSDTVPLRSWLGNTISRFAFQFALERPLSDTQSGLRGIPRSALPALLELEGDHYEYETNMLISAGRMGLQIQELPIATVYLDGNQASHFRPLLDSMRIYFVLLRFFSSSLAAAAVDLGVFALAWHLSAGYGLSFALARIASSLANFALNRGYVFHSAASVLSAVVRYYGLVVVVGLASFGTSRALLSQHVPVFAAKIGTDVTFSLVSFVAQKAFVFRNTPRRLG